MYICRECGNTFVDPDRWEEDRGFCGMSRAMEPMSGCPYCGGSYTDAAECTECVRYFAEDEMNDGLCPECYNEMEGRMDEHGLNENR